MSIEIGRRTLQEIIRLPPLPPLAEPRAELARALPALTPPERITVTEAAAKYMRIQVAGQWQDYDPRVAPYMVEPQDLTTSRRFRRLVFVGPSQSGKSQMLMACAAHAICCDPG
ncbi:phage terminase large subunit family protein, partial [Oceanicella sp. SM1341]|uniref:phage terminase large subunit family protein n=1 Tax=Oceanicella sp. SM1341 TaxID=1548889 RepID=UPI0018E595D3